MWRKQYHKSPVWNGNHTTYKNGDLVNLGNGWDINGIY